MPEGVGPVDPGAVAAALAAALALALATACLRPAWVVGAPRVVLLLLAGITLAAVATLGRLDPPGVALEIDPSTEPLLPAGDPGIAAYRRAVLAFGDDQAFLVALACDDLFRPRPLEALRAMGDAVSRLPEVRSVSSLMRATSFRYRAGDDRVELGRFIEEIPRDPPALDALRARALAHPVYRRNLVSEDGRAAALHISLRELDDREFIAADVDGRIRHILEREQPPGCRFHVTGRPHVKSRMYQGMTRDLALLIPAALLLVATALTLVTGSLRGVALPLGAVSLALLWTFGLMAWLERPLTVLTVLLAPALLAVGSVYGVHVVERHREEAERGGDPRLVALRCLVELRIPVCIAGFTTMAGYAALLTTDVPAVFELGAFSVLGVASVTAISLTGLPAALVLLPRRSSGPRPGFPLAARLDAALEAGLAGLARAVCRRTGATLGAWGAVALLALAALPRIAVDTDYLTFFDTGSAVRRDFDAVNGLLSGAVPLYVVVEGAGPGALRDPAVLERIEALQARIDALPGVQRTTSFLDTLRLANRALERDDPAAERLPATRQGVTELIFLLPKADLSRSLTVDQSAANVLVRTGAVGSAAMRDLTRGIEAAVAEVGLPASLRASVTGNAVLLDRAADGVARGQPVTLALAALATTGLLALGLRSTRLALLGMLPNLLPVLVFFASLGLGAAPLSLPTSLIGSVALGIAIDATAHYLVRYRAERRAGGSPEQAALRTGVRVGRPVAVAAGVLALGFLSVAWSEFATLRQFGLLSAFTMLVCLLADLTLLPALLLRWRV
jgi:predicted RND superfamily exporter protein